MENRVAVANRVTGVGIGINLVLMVLKFAAGIAGRSGAMIADAVHTLSDFATDLAVLVGVKLASHPPDAGHRYGHGKYETLSAVFVGIALLIVGVGILGTAVMRVIRSVQGEPLEAPGGIALIAAAVSILTKEGLYRYTVAAGRKIDSPALIANGWHHRSDSLSSIGVFLGIGGAMLLGEQWRILDPIAAVFVAVLILKVAVGIMGGGLRELLEESLPLEKEREILQLVEEFEEVSHPHNLRTRRIGGNTAIDLHIRVDPAMRVDTSHAVTVRMERAFRERFGANCIISIHVEPRPEENRLQGS